MCIRDRSLTPDGEPDYPKIENELKSQKIKAALIQRSKGYGDRPSYSSEKIGKITDFIKKISPDTIVDVYKRQVQYVYHFPDFPLVCSRSSRDDHISVSYTHLDVYKRQVLSFH